MDWCVCVRVCGLTLVGIFDRAGKRVVTARPTEAKWPRPPPAPPSTSFARRETTYDFAFDSLCALLLVTPAGAIYLKYLALRDGRAGESSI